VTRGESPPVMRLITRESTRIDNKDSEPKAQVRLLKFPEENSIFSKTRIFKPFCHCIGVAKGRQKGHGPPQKCLEHVVILCFERCFFKENSVM